MVMDISVPILCNKLFHVSERSAAVILSTTMAVKATEGSATTTRTEETWLELAVY